MRIRIRTFPCNPIKSLKKNLLAKNQGEAMISSKMQVIECTQVNVFAFRLGPAEKRGPQNEGISLLFAENKRDKKPGLPKTTPTPINITKISTYPFNPNMSLKIKVDSVEIGSSLLLRHVDPSELEKIGFRWPDDPMIRWPDSGWPDSSGSDSPMKNLGPPPFALFHSIRDMMSGILRIDLWRNSRPPSGAQITLSKLSHLFSILLQIEWRTSRIGTVWHTGCPKHGCEGLRVLGTHREVGWGLGVPEIGRTGIFSPCNKSSVFRQTLRNPLRKARGK
jgi:hypothetical protein